MSYAFDPSAIKRLRESLGLSIPEFAEKIGISKQAGYDLESCDPEKRPNVRTLEKLMSVFGASPMVFFVNNGACVQGNISE